MGSPKLLLPWGDTTLLGHVIRQWQTSGVCRVVVVVHPADKELADLAVAAGADVIAPDVPPPIHRDKPAKVVL